MSAGCVLDITESPQGAGVHQGGIMNSRSNEGDIEIS